MFLSAFPVQEYNLFIALNIIHPYHNCVHWIVRNEESIVDQKEAVSAPPIMVRHLLSFLQWLSGYNPHGAFIFGIEVERVIIKRLILLLTKDLGELFLDF